jgi:AraC-like DNA-binding protein
MEYREWPPHPALRPFVRAYWVLRGSEGEAQPQPVLPDGASELIVHRARPFYRHTAAQGVERQSERLFVGQMRVPVVLQAEGAADVVAVRFRPHGAYALFGCPQHVYADAIPDAEALEMPWLTAAMRRAQEAESAQAAIACLEEALLRRVPGRLRHDPRVRAALAAIERSEGDIRVETAAAHAGSGRRHLERLFREEVGIGPKVFARLVRFQAAAARVIGEPEVPLVRVSGESGYFDQSHMIRDFLAFAGSSPDELRRRLGQMTAWMLAAPPR